LDSWQKLIKNRSVGNIGFWCSYIINKEKEKKREEEYENAECTVHNFIEMIIINVLAQKYVYWFRM
jgi:hypothetical protein